MSLLLLACGAARSLAEDATYDVVIYGGTASGVAAAVQAARMGKRVVIIEPGDYLGGMTTGGLSYTDLGNTSSIGGFAGDFYRRLGREYDKTSSSFLFEPKVATDTIESLVREAGVTVYRNQRLDLAGGVAMTGSRIDALTTEAGLTVHGGVFVDATYEGDLMAGAGVSYAVGREATTTYNEKFNGVQTANAWGNQIVAPVDPYVIPGDPSSGLLPGVSGDAPGTQGAADNRIQAYNFRLTLTNDPANRRPWTAPANYDRDRYELLARYIQSAGVTQLKGTILKLSSIGHNKFDLNNEGGISTDNIGANYAYPDGDYATRDAITQDHRDYQQGLLYFLATDPAVPQNLRDEMNSYGLTYDEFVDNDGWSTQLYVREARRMVGQFVMTENEVLGRTSVDDPVGLASYTMDSHNVQRYVSASGNARNEGDIQVGVPRPYGVSYRAITPQDGEADNLLVPVALSSSHIAYGSMRMEPVFMILGQSAGTAAVLALDGDTSVQDVDYDALLARLRADGQLVIWQDTYTPGTLVSTITEDFDYGPDHNRIDIVSYTGGGWSQAWGPGRDYRDAKAQLNLAPAYDAGSSLTYHAPGYRNSAQHGTLLSGNAGTLTGDTYAPIVSGRGIVGGMTGEIWLSALVQLDSNDTDGEHGALLWLDRDANGNVDNAGDAFIALRTGGRIALRYAGSHNLAEADGITYDAGVTHLLLARIVIDADGSNDSLELWIDPDLLSLGDANLAVAGLNLFGDSFDGVGLSIEGADGALDALRISNLTDGFAQVTLIPEPATAVTLLVIAGFALCRNRK